MKKIMALILLAAMFDLAGLALADDSEITAQQLVNDINDNGNFTAVVDFFLGNTHRLCKQYYNQSAEYVTDARIQLHGESSVTDINGGDSTTRQPFGEWDNDPNSAGQLIKHDIFVDLNYINSITVVTDPGFGIQPDNQSQTVYRTAFTTTDGQTITGRYAIVFASLEIADQIASEILAVASNQGALVKKISHKTVK